MTPQDSTTMKSAKQAMRIDLSGRYKDSDVLELMNKAVFLDPRFKTLAYLSINCTVEDVTRSIQREMVKLLQQDSPEADQSSESITDQTNEVHEQPPPHKKKKCIP